eukprot:1148277-Pelagomonas_calceolata.AAC.3
MVHTHEPSKQTAWKQLWLCHSILAFKAKRGPWQTQVPPFLITLTSCQAATSWALVFPSRTCAARLLDHPLGTVVGYGHQGAHSGAASWKLEPEKQTRGVPQVSCHAATEVSTSGSVLRPLMAACFTHKWLHASPMNGCMLHPLILGAGELRRRDIHAHPLIFYAW